ncbi:hypothetical protein Sgly_1351 [Syntrophobotulus glycolicus DSM 8271]|uniref:Uncharacterized protein n=2 Tax=Syntrophobotulus TaxID=51196 RepID=F0SVV0_SYNGF|nr:hypothetical protein Sgly_1351 [Syntrophobotulus glycolicus DSM 8271]
MTNSWYRAQEGGASFFAFSPDPAPGRDGGPADDGFSQMHREMAAMALLYDIPFSYLVPAEGMLEPEEVRFFHLDPNWIRALLDGAFSIGRNVGVDTANDSAYLEGVYDKAMAAGLSVRLRLQGKPDLPVLKAVRLAKSSPCTGFLLRSELVSGWRGLEFNAYGDREGTDPLPALRLETLSDEVLIGLYQGVIARLDIQQPPEGFHFGFNSTDGKLSKRLRSLSTGALDDGRAEIPIRRRGNRVVDFADIAAAIGKELGMAPGETVTSAHLALQMIQNPHRIVIRIGEGDEQS